LKITLLQYKAKNVIISKTWPILGVLTINPKPIIRAVPINIIYDK
jgi:hypothetical protein